MAKIELNREEVVRRYTDGESQKSLATALGVDRSVVRRTLTECGVSVRDPTRANQLMMSLRTPEEHQRNTEAAHRATKSRVHTWGEKRKRAITRENHQTHTSPAELLVSEWIRQRGFLVTPQKAIDVYNIDLALPDNVAVEIYGGGWHAYGYHSANSNQRFELLLSRGWRVVVVWVDQQKYPLNESVADAILRFGFSSNTVPEKNDRGSFLVLRGDGSEFARGSHNLEILKSKPTRLGLDS